MQHIPNYAQASGFSSSLITIVAWIFAIAAGIEIYYIFAEKVDFLAGTVGFILKDNDAIGMLTFHIPVFVISLGVATQKMLIPIIAVLSLFALASMNGKVFHLEAAEGFDTKKLPRVQNVVVGTMANTISDTDMTLDDIKNASAAAIYARANGYTKGRGLTPAELNWCRKTNRADEQFVINCTSQYKWSKS